MTDMNEPVSIVDRLLNRDCLRALALDTEERVLDVGCGFGELTCAMAVASARVLGIDKDPTIVDAARAKALARGLGDRTEFRAGRAAELPLRTQEWGSFNVAHARFLLESLRDPRAAVAQMVRAVRPGGRIVLVDDDHETLRLWPEAPRVMAAWRAYLAWFDAAGGDSVVGRKLVAILHDSGARPVRAASLSFGVCAGEASFTDAVARLRSILETERQGILTTGCVDEAGLEAALDELSAWALRPDSAAFYVVRLAEGRSIVG